MGRMRYRVVPEEENLTAEVWEGPWGYELSTVEEKRWFPLDGEGAGAAAGLGPGLGGADQRPPCPHHGGDHCHAGRGPGPEAGGKLKAATPSGDPEGAAVLFSGPLFAAYQSLARSVDIAGANGEDQVAGLGQGPQALRYLRESGAVAAPGTTRARSREETPRSSVSRAA